MKVKVRLGIMLATRHSGNADPHWDPSQRVPSPRDPPSIISHTSNESHNPLYMRAPRSSGDGSESRESDGTSANEKLQATRPLGEGRSRSTSPLRDMVSAGSSRKDSQSSVKRSSRSLSPKKGSALLFLGGSKREEDQLTPADFIHAVRCVFHLLRNGECACDTLLEVCLDRYLTLSRGGSREKLQLVGSVYGQVFDSVQGRISRSYNWQVERELSLLFRLARSLFVSQFATDRLRDCLRPRGVETHPSLLRSVHDSLALLAPPVKATSLRVWFMASAQVRHQRPVFVREIICLLYTM
jgi:hypothetical protein